jgi:hypothetical protein
MVYMSIDKFFYVMKTINNYATLICDLQASLGLTQAKFTVKVSTTDPSLSRLKNGYHQSCKTGGSIFRRFGARFTTVCLKLRLVV